MSFGDVLNLLMTCGTFLVVLLTFVVLLIDKIKK